MLIIISKNSTNVIFNENKNKDILFLDKLCYLKNIKDKNNTLIIDSSLLNDNGIVKYYHYHIDELFISLSISRVLSFNTNDKIKEVCNYHNKKLINI